MKKKIILLVAMVLCIATVFCACGKNNEGYSHDVSVKLDGCTVKISTSDDYVLESFSEGNSIGFAAYFNDGVYDNFAIGSFLPADVFETFKLNIITSDEVTDVYENTSTMIYYSIPNEEDSSYTEYNRMVKLNDSYVMYLGAFDKDAVDAFYKTLDVIVK